MLPILGPASQLQEVKDLWGTSACESLQSILTEFDDLFMEHKADIGRCTIVKHPVDVEFGAVPHREGARRMSPEKAERANQEVRNLLALGMIQPSLSPWGSDIVMIKKKNGELRFCCEFRPLNEVTIKHAYPLPRIDENLSRLGKVKIYISLDLACAFWQILVRKADQHKLVAALHTVTGLNSTFAWGPEQQQAFNEIKKALIDETALAQPDCKVNSC